MSNDELLDIVDEGGKVIKTIRREEAERDNHITKNVLIFIFTPSGHVWIQKRPMAKKHYPGLWDISACGGIVSGENPELSAKREQLEEMGFESELHFVEAFMHEFPGEDGSVRRRLSHLFIGISEDIPKVSHEVDEFKAIQHDELHEKIQKNREAYVPSFLEELEMAKKAFIALRTKKSA